MDRGGESDRLIGGGGVVIGGQGGRRAGLDAGDRDGAGNRCGRDVGCRDGLIARCGEDDSGEGMDPATRGSKAVAGRECGLGVAALEGDGAGVAGRGGVRRGLAPVTMRENGAPTVTLPAGDGDGPDASRREVR